MVAKTKTSAKKKVPPISSGITKASRKKKSPRKSGPASTKILLESKPEKDACESVDSKKIEILGWNKEDLSALILRMESDAVPSNDTFKKQLSKYDWKKLRIGVHTGEQCTEAWNEIVKHLRKYRTLAEIVQDVKVVLIDSFQKKVDDSNPKSKKLKLKKKQDISKAENLEMDTSEDSEPVL